MTLRFFESAEEATSEVSDDDQDEPWTDQLSDFAVPVFALQPAINFDVPHDPLAVIFFSAFIGDDLWDHIVAETNRYAQQQLSQFPERLAKFEPVTRDRAELKAFIGVNIIMAMVKLPR